MSGAGMVTDTLDFVKNLWGSMGVPGAGIPAMTTPTLSVDDLDKKIKDLKAVESWLNVNMAMVRGTIQALEVQRGTLATLKAMGEAMAQAVQQPGGAQPGQDGAPFASMFFGQPAAKAEAAAAPDAAPGPDGTGHPSTADAGAAAFSNAAVWWNLLQDQFKQAVSTAMSPEAAAEMSKSMAQTMAGNAMKAAAPEESASRKPAGKPADAKARGNKARP
jgi:hypothetical protein